MTPNSGRNRRGGFFSAPVAATARHTWAVALVYGRSPSRGHAATRAQLLRSEMRTRSNSATAAKTLKTSSPDADVVSFAAISPMRTRS